jgi:O-antigen/teichoic acid export membrane protein
MSRIKQLGKDVSIYGMGIAVSKLINFLLVPLYTRVFSITEYGTLNVYLTLGSFVSVVFSFQIAIAMLRFYFDSEEEAYRKEVVSSGFLFLLIISFLLVLLSFIIPEKSISFFLKDVADKTLFRLMIVNNALLVLFFYLQMLLRVQRKPKLFSLFTASQIIVSTTFILVYVFISKWGIKSVFAGNISGLSILILVLIIRSKKLISFSFNYHLFVKMFMYGFILMITLLGVSANQDLNRLILLRYKTVDQIALIGLAVKVSGFISLLLTAFQQAWAPYVFSIMNESGSKRFYSKVFESFVLLFPVIIVISAYAPEIVSLLAPETYSKAAILIPFQLLGILIFSMSSILKIGVHIKKKPFYEGASVYSGLIINTSLMIILLKTTDLGITAAPISFAVGNIFQAIMIYHYSQKLYYIDYKVNKMIIMVLATIIYIVLFTFSSYGIIARTLVMISYLIIFIVISNRVIIETCKVIMQIIKKRKIEHI